MVKSFDSLVLQHPGQILLWFLVKTCLDPSLGGFTVGGVERGRGGWYVSLKSLPGGVFKVSVSLFSSSFFYLVE